MLPIYHFELTKSRILITYIELHLDHKTIWALPQITEGRKTKAKEGIMIPQLLFEQRHRLEPDLEKLDDTWDDLLRVVDWTTTPSSSACASKNDAWGKEIIILGATPSGYNGLVVANHLLFARPQSTIILSGGVYGNEQVSGEVGAFHLFEELKASLLNLGIDEQKIKERVIIDSASMHTGHQRVILGSLLNALAPDIVWLVMPIYHITRFVMSVGLPLYEKGFRPDIRPWPYGTWDQRHPLLGPKDEQSKNFTYEEMFALPPSPDRHRKDKLNCGDLDKILMYASPQERQCLTFRQARAWLRI